MNTAHSLKVTRVMHGMSQELLAELSGLTQTTLSFIENGMVQPQESSKKKIESVFDKPVDWTATYDTGRIHQNGKPTTQNEDKS